MARDICVKVNFNVDEFIELRRLADSLGLSQSALLRMLAKVKMNEIAMHESSINGDAITIVSDWASRPYISNVNPLALLPETGSRRRQ